MACVPASILIAHFFTVNRGKCIFWLFHFSVVMFYRIINDTYMEFLIAYGYIGVFIAFFLSGYDLAV